MAGMLSALGYHRSVLAVVRQVDERAWAALHGGPEGSLDEVLLRNAYRLEADVHPDVFRAGNGRLVRWSWTRGSTSTR